MGWGRGGGPVLGMSIGIIISDQPLDMGEFFMQVVVSLLLFLEVMVLLSGFVLPQDPESYGLQENNCKDIHCNTHNLTFEVKQFLVTKL